MIMTAPLPRLVRDRFPALVYLAQVPPAAALITLLGVAHPFYRAFPVLLFAAGLAFWHPAFVSGRARLLPPLFYFGLISLLSSTTTRTSRPVAGFVFHPAEFFFLALLLAWALSRSPFAGPRRVILTVLGACALAGALDEAHQAFVPGRVADPLDWVLDLLGAAAGCAFFFLLPRALRAPRDARPDAERIPA